MLKYNQLANISDSISREIDQILTQGKTEFQEYLFFNSKKHGVCIALDGDIQSCESDEAMYHESLVHPALLLHDNPKHVLIMGGGEGATAREVLRHPNVEKVVMVDIDQEFVTLCRKWIPGWGQAAFSDPRLEVIYCDIKAYLEAQTQQFDIVIGDLVDIHDWDSPVAALYGEQLYALLKTRMKPDAILATQGGAMVAQDMDGHNHIRQTLKNCFKNVNSYGMVIPSFYHLWGFVIASDAALDVHFQDLSQHFADKMAKTPVHIQATGIDALAAAFVLPNMIKADIKV